MQLIFTYSIEINPIGRRLVSAYKKNNGELVICRTSQNPVATTKYTPKQLEEYWKNQLAGIKVDNYRVDEKCLVQFIPIHPLTFIGTAIHTHQMAIQWGMPNKRVTSRKGKLVTVYEMANGMACVAIEGEGVVEMPTAGQETYTDMKSAYGMITNNQVVDLIGNVNPTKKTEAESDTTHPCNCPSHTLFLKGCQCGGC